MLRRRKNDKTLCTRHDIVGTWDAKSDGNLTHITISVPKNWTTIDTRVNNKYKDKKYIGFLLFIACKD